MIDRDDLRAAVAAGTLTEAQAAKLTDLAQRRRAGQVAIRPGEEPFELFRGMGEIFIVVGLGILAIGWVGVWFLLADSGNIRLSGIMACIATLGLIAALSEYFIRHRRMVAPAIALTLGWAATAMTLGVIWNDALTVFGALDAGRATLPLWATVAATLIYWWRYRVPFAMATMAALSFIGLIVMTLQPQTNLSVETLFLFSSGTGLSWVTLGFGLVLLTLAMWFDMGDPHRLSLRSANGFWLHVIAAPAIVNPVALSLLDTGGPGPLAWLSVFLLAMAVFALAIDRRSFLIAAIGYIVALIFIGTEGDGLAGVILGLGVALVGLGAGWQSVRSVILRPLPQTLRNRLPPAA